MCVCVLLKFFAWPRSILWGHWLPLFRTSCDSPHGFQSQGGSLAGVLLRILRHSSSGRVTSVIHSSTSKLTCPQLWSWKVTECELNEQWNRRGVWGLLKDYRNFGALKMQSHAFWKGFRENFDIEKLPFCTWKIYLQIIALQFWHVCVDEWFPKLTRPHRF